MKLMRIKDFYLLIAIALIKVVSCFSSPRLKEVVVNGLAVL